MLKGFKNYTIYWVLKGPVPVHYSILRYIQPDWPDGFSRQGMNNLNRSRPREASVLYNLRQDDSKFIVQFEKTDIKSIIFAVNILTSKNMSTENLKQFETSENLQKMVLNIMYTMREKYHKYPEYKTIMMNLTTVSRELNAIRIKEITGEIEGTDNE